MMLESYVNTYFEKSGSFLTFILSIVLFVMIFSGFHTYIPRITFPLFTKFVSHSKFISFQEFLELRYGMKRGVCMDNDLKNECFISFMKYVKGYDKVNKKNDRIEIANAEIMNRLVTSTFGRTQMLKGYWSIFANQPTRQQSETSKADRIIEFQSQEDCNVDMEDNEDGDFTKGGHGKTSHIGKGADDEETRDGQDDHKNVVDEDEVNMGFDENDDVTDDGEGDHYIGDDQSDDNTEDGDEDSNHDESDEDEQGMDTVH